MPMRPSVMPMRPSVMLMCPSAFKKRFNI
jgi:hypothetical protein